MGIEQFLWITLVVISIDAFVILLFRKALFETWRRIYLRWMCTLLFFITFLVVKEALDWASIFFWYFYSFLVSGLPFLMTFLFYKKEAKENKIEWKEKGYIERLIPRGPFKKRGLFKKRKVILLYKIGSNDFIEVDTRYRLYKRGKN